MFDVVDDVLSKDDMMRFRILPFLAASMAVVSTRASGTVAEPSRVNTYLVFFPAGLSTLDEASKTVIAQAVREQETQQDVCVKVDGFGGYDEPSPVALSRARVLAVAAALTRAGTSIPISIHWYGDMHPMSPPNGFGYVPAENRRTQVIWHDRREGGCAATRSVRQHLGGEAAVDDPARRTSRSRLR